MSYSCYFHTSLRLNNEEEVNSCLLLAHLLFCLFYYSNINILRQASFCISAISLQLSWHEVGTERFHFLSCLWYVAGVLLLFECVKNWCTGSNDVLGRGRWLRQTKEKPGVFIQRPQEDKWRVLYSVQLLRAFIHWTCWILSTKC